MADTKLHPLSCIYTINRHQFVELYWQKNLQVDMKLRSIVFLLLVLFAGIIANAKTLKLSKNIIYEGAVGQWKFSGDKHKSLQVDTERTFHQRYPLVML